MAPSSARRINGAFVRYVLMNGNAYAVRRFVLPRVVFSLTDDECYMLVFETAGESA
jgi:hypothetical protein